MTSVGSAFPREVLRVRELVDAYRSLPSDTGAIAASSMLGTIERALAAWETQDVVAIVRTYSELRAWA